MLFRAAFWIGLVALLLQRCPQLELSPVFVSTSHEMTAPGSLASWQSELFEHLVQIRADIETQQRARSAQADLFRTR